MYPLHACIYIITDAQTSGWMLPPEKNGKKFTLLVDFFFIDGKIQSVKHYIIADEEGQHETQETNNRR
jgi:hypothetical protein